MNISLNDSDFEDGINLKKILMKVLDKTKNTILYVECDTTNESCWIGTSIHITTFDEIVEMILVANDECNICYTGQTNDIICISFRDKDFENNQNYKLYLGYVPKDLSYNLSTLLDNS